MLHDQDYPLNSVHEAGISDRIYAVDAVRTVSPMASAVLERLAGNGRLSLSLGSDGDWLREISPSYLDLLQEMKQRKLLYPVIRGSYVVAPRASSDLDQAAPPELLADLVMRDRSPYYIGFLSALIAHGLTDLHTNTVYVAVPANARTDLTAFDLGATRVQLVRLSQRHWPHTDAEWERRRVVPGTRERVTQSTMSRTLVDGLLRPDLCDGIETVIQGWGRAVRRNDFDPEEVWAIAHPMGPALSKRVALLLRETGHKDVVASDLEALRSHRARVPLDRSNAIGRKSDNSWPLDRATGVSLNIPPGALQGWMAEQVG